MMDILTVLLLFLLKSFVAEGEVVTPAPGVNLPTSTSPELPEATLVLAISEENLLLGDRLVGEVSAIAEQNPMTIEPLAALLVEARDQSDEIARLQGREEQSTGRITIQGDREIPFRVLQKVMYTCQQSGYASISLAVIKS